MLRFAQRAAIEDVARYVKEVFYDSKASMCSFTLDPAVQEGNPVARKLYAAAKESINQFYWLDGVNHRTELAETEEA